MNAFRPVITAAWYATCCLSIQFTRYKFLPDRAEMTKDATVVDVMHSGNLCFVLTVSPSCSQDSLAFVFTEAGC